MLSSVSDKVNKRKNIPPCEVPQWHLVVYLLEQQWKRDKNEIIFRWLINEKIPSLPRIYFIFDNRCNSFHSFFDINFMGSNFRYLNIPSNCSFSIMTDLLLPNWCSLPSSPVYMIFFLEWKKRFTKISSIINWNALLNWMRKFITRQQHEREWVKGIFWNF